MPNNLNFAVDKLSANRRPCRGVGLQYRVEKLARLLCKFWPYKYSKSGLHAFYRTYYPDYVFSEETGKFCHREDHGCCSSPDCSSPPPLLLMSFVGQNAIQLQAMLKTLTRKFKAFEHTGTTWFGRLSGNVNCNTNT